MTYFIQAKTLNSSFTEVDIDERTEPKITESKFKTEVEEKVQNDNVKLEIFTVDELLSFPTDNLVKIKRLYIKSY